MRILSELLNLAVANFDERMLVVQVVFTVSIASRNESLKLPCRNQNRDRMEFTVTNLSRDRFTNFESQKKITIRYTQAAMTEL